MKKEETATTLLWDNGNQQQQCIATAMAYYMVLCQAKWACNLFAMSV